MWSLYDTIFRAHDLRFVVLAMGVCALGCLTGSAIARFSLEPGSYRNRLKWLLLAGLVTGLGIWTTHFTAMLGYRSDFALRYDLRVAALSLILCLGLTLVGGLAGLIGKKRGVVAGFLVGCGIAVAHFLDMHALRFAGSVQHDPFTNLVAIAVGLSLAGLSGYALVRSSTQVFAWKAVVPMFSAVLSLHFIAMSGATFSLTGVTPSDLSGTASADELANVIVAAFLVILVVAIAYTVHSQRLAQATVDEQRRLILALEELRKTQDHHRAYIELNPQIAWVADPQGQVTEIAPRWSDLVGKSREAAYGTGWLEVLHPADRSPVLDLWTEAVRTKDGDKADIRYRILLVDGSYRWFRARARPRLDDNGSVKAWYGSLEDIHEQALAEEALRASEERYRLASRATSDVIWDWSFKKERATWAGAYKNVLGYPELAGETDLNWWIDRIHPDDRDGVLFKQTEAFQAGAEYLNDEYRFLNASGEWIDFRSRCVIVRDENGEPARLVGSMLDITQQKKAEAELNWAAYHDSLTTLPNRAMFAMRKREAIAAARTKGTCVALALLDLNGFKEINDSLGHPAGDQLLKEAGQRLLEAAGPRATVFRLGGDEFAIVIPDLSAPDGYKKELQEITRAFDQPFELRGIRLPVSHSTGVAIWPRDADVADELLIAADLALYAAKGELPGTMLEFSPSLRAEAENRTKMLLAARSALSEGRIVAVYQPKVDLHTGNTDGWEALLRVQGANGDLLPPTTIKAAFDDAEQAVQLTDRMLASVFTDLSHWRASGIDPGRIAVNVSAADFRHRDLASDLHALAKAVGQDLSGIDIEVTETVLIGELGPEVARMLARLRSLGVRVALDDFGTGYASLTHLQQFPVDMLKIDKSFVDRIRGGGSKETVVIDAVIQMARQLGLATVAEGVETDLQASYLRARGCNQAQGFLFSPPMTADEVANAMRLPTRSGFSPQLEKVLGSRGKNNSVSSQT